MGKEKVLLAHASPIVPQNEGVTLYVEVVVLRKMQTPAPSSKVSTRLKVCRTARRGLCIIW